MNAVVWTSNGNMCFVGTTGATFARRLALGDERYWEVWLSGWSTRAWRAVVDDFGNLVCVS